MASERTRISPRAHLQQKVLAKAVKNLTAYRRSWRWQWKTK
jgi:hypothetical protein